MLNKDQTQRLGSSNEALDIFTHPFFDGIDWEKVQNREMTPPFKPPVQSSEDTKMFYVNKPVSESSFYESPSISLKSSVKSDRTFEKFEY